MLWILYGEGGDEQRRHEDYSRLGQAGQRRKEVYQNHLGAEQGEVQHGVDGAAFDDYEYGNDAIAKRKKPQTRTELMLAEKLAVSSWLRP